VEAAAFTKLDADAPLAGVAETDAFDRRERKDYGSLMIPKRAQFWS
jgi:hypothetical protein